MANPVVLFANPRAGSARRVLGPALHELARAAIPVESVHIDLESERAARVLEEARSRGVTRVVVVGGDGTIGTMADILAGSQMTMGIVPAGTSNNIAAVLGIPTSTRRAVSIVVNGEETTIDLGRANGRCFVQAAMLGFHVEFAREAQRMRQVMGRLSYPAASLAVYARRRLLGVSFSAGEERLEIRAYQAAVVTPPPGENGTEIENGLTFLTVEDLRFRSLVRNLPEIFVRKHLGLPLSRSMAFRSARIETEEPVPMTLDGEIATSTPVDIELVRDALRVLVPRGGRRRLSRPGS